ncbi:hypothetical protein SAMN05444169_5119 [Bradyrhizobium erythrophlei]|uniref:Uncharacterized protein n=1 Tax=Bradyrhizobium erythrophlei TaxID=1437360 RepID=A0A1M5PAX7_9BRAD|nr:hypothetical protein SAMN05444169_5119 [Bradyrhizobium erythrophlei]
MTRIEFALRLGRYKLSAIRWAFGQGDGIDTRHFPMRAKKFSDAETLTDSSKHPEDGSSK